MAVSVGFSNICQLLDWFGLHPTRVGSPPLTFPAALSTWKAHALRPGLASRFNCRVHHCDVLTISWFEAYASQPKLTMYGVRNQGILASSAFGRALFTPLTASLRPQRLARDSHRGHRFFTVHWIRSVSPAAEDARTRNADVPIGIMATLAVCTILYVGVSSFYRACSLQTLMTMLRPSSTR